MQKDNKPTCMSRETTGNEKDQMMYAACLDVDVPLVDLANSIVDSMYHCFFWYNAS